MDYEQIESSQRQHQNDLQHQERMNALVEQSEYSLFAQLKPKLYQDGNKWCVLHGENIQTGIAAFGDTPQEAVMAWNMEWYKSLSNL